MLAGRCRYFLQFFCGGQIGGCDELYLYFKSSLWKTFFAWFDSCFIVCKYMHFMADNMTDLENTPSTCNDGQTGKTNDRRRFLGAGTVAAPFLMTMVSQPALGVQCFTPSRSLSKNTSLSQTAKNGNCTGAESPGNYAAQQTLGAASYHWPSAVPPSTLMHPLFYQGGSQGVTCFTKKVNGSWVSQTLGEALLVNAPGQVHFHIIAAYLNKKGGNNAVIPDTAITEQGIKDIWKEYATKGYYQPSATVKWYEAEIVNYLKNNGIVG